MLLDYDRRRIGEESRVFWFLTKLLDQRPIDFERGLWLVAGRHDSKEPKDVALANGTGQRDIAQREQRVPIDIQLPAMGLDRPNHPLDHLGLTIEGAARAGRPSIFSDVDRHAIPNSGAG